MLMCVKSCIPFQKNSKKTVNIQKLEYAFKEEMIPQNQYLVS